MIGPGFLLTMKNENPAGVLVVDKPENMSSAGVVKRIKRFPGIKKAGHAGTLDPQATGILLCPVNQATRLSRFFLQGWKTYDAVMLLGIETDTQDAAGTVTRSSEIPKIDKAAVENAIAPFQGEIRQMPPIYSALKHKGRPLYEYARNGQPVQKPARRVSIEKIAVNGMDLPEIRLTVRCSSGTYIRTLCADIGHALGCGGHLKQLRRTESSGFTIDEARGLDEYEKPAADGRLSECLVPMAKALRTIPAHIADKALTERIKYGKMIYLNDIDGTAETDYLKILDPDENLLAVLSRDERAHPGRFRYCCVFHHV